MNPIILKLCRDCKEEKPLSDFYRQANTPDGHTPRCKPCHGKEMAKYAKKDARTKAGHWAEELVVNRLMSMGIFAVPGKRTTMKWVDVVAWGCVTVEVKSAKFKNGSYRFDMGSQRRRKKIQDIVVLVTEDTKQCYLFTGDNPLFYRADGSIKPMVAYNSSGVYLTENSLTTSLLNDALDKWQLIEDRRQAISKELINGSFVMPNQSHMVRTDR